MMTEALASLRLEARHHASFIPRALTHATAATGNSSDVTLAFRMSVGRPLVLTHSPADATTLRGALVRWPIRRLPATGGVGKSS